MTFLKGDLMLDKTEKAPETEPEEGGSHRMDPELRTIAAILRMLDDLTEPGAKSRIVAYLVARYAATERG